jgi:hypothetical protein
MHIEWKRIDPTSEEVPYVTFISPRDLKGENVLKAEYSYELNDQEAGMVRGEHEWPSGFKSMSPTEAALSSSVAAMPAPPTSSYYNQNNEDMVLPGSKDARLQKGLWGRVRLLRVAGIDATWGNAWDLDDVIQFDPEVRKVKLRRINRELKQAVGRPRNEYHVVRTPHGPAETLTLEVLAIQESERYLHNTYWSRIPDILGQVSDDLEILTARLTMCFTGQFGGPRTGGGAHYLHLLEAQCQTSKASPVCSLS